MDLSEALDDLLEDRESRKQDMLARISKGQLPKVTPTDVETALDISEPYALWLVIRKSKDDLDLSSNKSMLTQLLKDFDIKKKGAGFTASKDIMTYRSLEDLKSVVVSSALPTKTKERELAIQGAKVVASEPPWEVIELTTIEACAKVLRGKVWCVKDPESSRYYLKSGPLYLVNYNNKMKYLYSRKDGFSNLHNRVVKIKDKDLYTIMKRVAPKDLEKWGSFSVLSKEDQIRLILGGAKYTINPSDGTVDVDDDVDLHNKGLTKIPFKFGKVTGDFYCYNNSLTSLQGAPTSVGGHFYCARNSLTSLQGAPSSVGGNFDCYDNSLTSLQGAPSSVGGGFYCHSNPKLPKSEIDMYRKSGAVKGKIHESELQRRSCMDLQEGVQRIAKLCEAKVQDLLKPLLPYLDRTSIGWLAHFSRKSIVRSEESEQVKRDLIHQLDNLYRENNPTKMKDFITNLQKDGPSGVSIEYYPKQDSPADKLRDLVRQPDFLEWDINKLYRLAKSRISKATGGDLRTRGALKRFIDIVYKSGSLKRMQDFIVNIVLRGYQLGVIDVEKEMGVKGDEFGSEYSGPHHASVSDIEKAMGWGEEGDDEEGEEDYLKKAIAAREKEPDPEELAPGAKPVKRKKYYLPGEEEGPEEPKKGKKKHKVTAKIGKGGGYEYYSMGGESKMKEDRPAGVGVSGMKEDANKIYKADDDIDSILGDFNMLDDMRGALKFLIKDKGWDFDKAMAKVREIWGLPPKTEVVNTIVASVKDVIDKLVEAPNKESFDALMPENESERGWVLDDQEGEDKKYCVTWNQGTGGTVVSRTFNSEAEAREHIAKLKKLGVDAYMDEDAEAYTMRHGTSPKESGEEWGESKIDEVISHEGSKWVLYNHDRTKKLGTYPTKEQAVKRLRAVEYFKHQESLDRLSLPELIERVKSLKLDEDKNSDSVALQKLVGEMENLSIDEIYKRASEVIFAKESSFSEKFKDEFKRHMATYLDTQNKFQVMRYIGNIVLAGGGDRAVKVMAKGTGPEKPKKRGIPARYPGSVADAVESLSEAFVSEAVPDMPWLKKVDKYDTPAKPIKEPEPIAHPTSLDRVSPNVKRYIKLLDYTRLYPLGFNPFKSAEDLEEFLIGKGQDMNVTDIEAFIKAVKEMNGGRLSPDDIAKAIHGFRDWLDDPLIDSRDRVSETTYGRSLSEPVVCPNCGQTDLVKLYPSGNLVKYMCKNCKKTFLSSDQRPMSGPVRKTIASSVQDKIANLVDAIPDMPWLKKVHGGKYDDLEIGESKVAENKSEESTIKYCRVCGKSPSQYAAGAYEDYCKSCLARLKEKGIDLKYVDSYPEGGSKMRDIRKILGVGEDTESVVRTINLLVEDPVGQMYRVSKFVKTGGKSVREKIIKRDITNFEDAAKLVATFPHTGDEGYDPDIEYAIEEQHLNG